MALSFFGELLQLSRVYVAHPFPAFLDRWADPRVVGNTAVTITQGLHVRAILFDPCAELIRSTDGPMTWDKNIDVARQPLDQPQRGEVVLNRVSGAHIEHRNQDIRKHVAGDENPAFLDQQRRMAYSMRLMLDDPNLGTVPRNLCRCGGQASDETQQVQRYLDLRR